MSIAFIEAVTSSRLSQADREYLRANQEFTHEIHSNCNSVASFLGRQIGHIAFTPYKILALSAQTIIDLALIILIGITAPFTRPSIAAVRKEFLGRSYNLLVADTFAWLSIVPSLIFHPICSYAENLHLGTFRAILSD